MVYGRARMLGHEIRGREAQVRASTELYTLEKVEPRNNVVESGATV
jgi:hypothetical protein